MDGYSREKRPLADSLAKIQCSIEANSAWSASSQNEYRKLYERASMSTRICSRNINRAIKSIPPYVYINKYRDSCRSLLTKAGSINLAGRKANSEIVISRTPPAEARTFVSRGRFLPWILPGIVSPRSRPRCRRLKQPCTGEFSAKHRPRVSNSLANDGAVERKWKYPPAFVRCRRNRRHCRGCKGTHDSSQPREKEIK